MESQPSDEHITMLMGMGFGDITDIRRALKLAKNDLNDAVAILTGEDSRGGFGQADIEMKEVSNSTEVYNNNNSPVMFGPQLPVVEGGKQPTECIDITEEEEVAENIDMAIEDMPDEFPTTNMYELEDRVFTENWSIPYKKGESLAKCLYGAIKLASQQKAETDKDCERFLDRVAVECFKKLLTSQAVKKWSNDIHEGVFNMIQLFIDFMAERLKYSPPPLKLLGTLSLAFDPDSEFHFKNRTHKWNRGHYEDIFGFDKCPAVSPDYNTYKAPFGWLVDLINRFVQKGGLDSIIDIVETMDKMSPNVLASLLKPFGACAVYLNAEVTGYKLGGMADKVVQFVSQMEADDMKDKDVDKVYDLLRSLRKVCDVLWADKTSNIVELHLSTILKMLQLPQFNPRMNALKELSRLIKDAERNQCKEITVDVISKWLLDNKVLSIAFSSSLHHAQYSEKLQKIVDFASSKISLEELTTIWDMQIGKHITVVDNIHSIISSAIQNFSVEQMEHFLKLLEKSWDEEDDKSKERLLLLLGKVGREIKDNQIVTQILDLLWNFSHLEEDLPLYLINQAVQSHIDVLCDSSLITIATKTDYVSKCVQDIKNNTWVVPGIRHILCNLESIAKKNMKNTRPTIQDIQQNNQLMKLLTSSLSQSHKTATSSILPGTLSGETIINNSYKYAEIIMTHLKLIQFLLKDGNLYLSYGRAKEIWDCLMLDENNCDGDYETCLEWFYECIRDLQADTLKELFTQKLLKTDVSRMKEMGLKCFIAYFETVNTNEHRIHRSGSSLVVDKTELIGMPYLWQLVLKSPYGNIAEEATQYLIDVSFSWLSNKLKKVDSFSIHKKFMGECCKRLEHLLSQLKENEDCSPKEGKITRTFKKPHPIKGSSIERSKVFLSIERLLHLTCNYIITVEDGYALPRAFPSHGSCYHGYPIQIHITCESNKTEIDVMSHSNERLSAVRQKIANKLDCPVEGLQILMNDKTLLSDKDHKLLLQLSFEKKQNLTAKLLATIKATSGGATGTLLSASASSSASNDSVSPVNKMDREKCLPGFLLAVEYRIFDKLYTLAELEEPQITCVLRNLLQQLPTDGDVLQAIDVFSFQNPMLCSPGTRAGYTTSSTSVLENYFKCTAPKMSTFRVLYNLQVLSSKLMPVLGIDAPNVTQSFRENWLNAGGLRLIMNILLPDTLPSNADYELRQSCYYIILQLARFLLCGDEIDMEPNSPPYPAVVRTYGQTSADDTPLLQHAVSLNTTATDSQADVSMNSTSTPIKVGNTSSISNQSHSPVASSWPGARAAANDSPGSVRELSSSPGGNAASFTPDGNLRKRLRSTSSVLESVSPTVKMVIENINEEEFKEIISSLLQVSWSAAAGQLQLNTKQNSTTPVASSSGEAYSNPFTHSKQQTSSNSSMLHYQLKAGLCLSQETVSIMDSVLANNSLELLVMCLQLRPNLMDLFYKLPNVDDFIVDVLTGSPSFEVRAAASLHFSVLSMTLNNTMDTHPKAFLIKTLLKAHLPVWNISGTIRGHAYKILTQCEQYFELLSNLLCQLSLSAQTEYNINPSQLLEGELNFLQNSDNLNVEMLTGHLSFSSALFTCEGIDKTTQGCRFLTYLLNEFLFSASKLEHANTSLSTFSVLDINIHSFNSQCRQQAFNLLLTTADRCPGNIASIADELTRRHHNQVISKEWAFQPAISARPANGFVGLSNAGATCYMNSILQQLYMQPGIREALLKVEDQQSTTKDTILSQVQNIFGHLLESQTQFFKPEGFWKTFKLWGEPVNLREQQDALEFYTNITDQLDEHLKTLKKEEIFKKAFSGTFVDQKTCSDCSHCFERDEPFSSLPVTVKSGNLEASLEQFVHTEVMEGENAYYCEKCRDRRTTVKRTCIKKLPGILVIQLKRFWYDWERNRAIKFDDFFKFPTILDMEPYTKEGIKKQELDQQKHGSNTSHSEPMRVVTDNQRYYELVGVVVHSGQASAGHYYSYIKNRQSTVGDYNKWYKFNDTHVEKFDMTDEALHQELFGGEYKVPQTEGNNQYPENRVRNWNAYMLFYESMDKNRLPNTHFSTHDARGQMFGDIFRSYPASPASSTASSNPPSPGSKDSLSQLSALIRKGEKKGLFTENMPTYIKRNVNEANKEFMCNCDIYNKEYFLFIRELCNVNTKPSIVRKILSEENSDEINEDKAIISLIQLSTQYLINTYFKTAKSFRTDLEQWKVTLENLFNSNLVTNKWFCDFFGQPQQRPYLVMYLLECPEADTRQLFSTWLIQACRNILNQLNKVTDEIDALISQLLTLLDSEAGHHIKQSSQYFSFFHRYSLLSFEALSHLLDIGAFRKFQNFLLGSRSLTNPEKLIRRWTSAQTLELLSLHQVMSTIVINVENESLHTVSTDIECPPPRKMVQYPNRLKINKDLCELFYGIDSDRYLHELLFATIEIPHANECVYDVIMYGCWCNLAFSLTFFQQIQMFLAKAQVSDFVNLFPLLKGVLCLDDPHQTKRIECCVGGSTEDDIEGLFNLIHNSRNENGRRSYECVKFLTSTAKQIPKFREYISHEAQYKDKLDGAVKWLEKKLSEGSFWQSNKTSSTTPSFRRTTSEQNTLHEATKLLDEMESLDASNTAIVEIT
uniref:ubiquitinyl hydrolase 1 n=1 Tax=Clytia hemisphaerica TaxID=252671 RepID=A0A7M5XH66_9CNID